MDDDEDTVEYSAPRVARINFDSSLNAPKEGVDEPLFDDLSRAILTVDAILSRTLA